LTRAQKYPTTNSDHVSPVQRDGRPFYGDAALNTMLPLSNFHMDQLSLINLCWRYWIDLSRLFGSAFYAVTSEVRSYEMYKEYELVIIITDELILVYMHGAMLSVRLFFFLLCFISFLLFRFAFIVDL